MTLRFGIKLFKKTKLRHVIPTRHQTSDSAAIVITFPKIAVKPHKKTQTCKSRYALETGFKP